MPTVKLPHVGWRKTKPVRADGMIYVQLVWTPHGEEKGLETVGWTTPEEAAAAAGRKAVELQAGRLGLLPRSSLVEPDCPTLGELIGEYADDIEARQVGGAGYRTNVINRAVHLVRHLGKIRVDKLTLRDLEDYVAVRRRERGGRALTRARAPGPETGSTPSRITVQCELRQLRSVVLRTASWGRHDARWPGMPSFQGWPKDARPARQLTPQEHKLLVEAAEGYRPELARLIAFMGWCGRRPVAIFDMRREDCMRALDPAYDGRNVVFFRRDKGGEGVGWGPLLPEARAVLVEHMRDTIGPPGEHVWQPHFAKLYTANVLGRLLVYVCEKAGVRHVTPYDLRKLAAVRAHTACRGKARATIAFTGHADPATLQRHYLFEEEDVVLAAARGTITERDTDADTGPAKRR